MAPLSRAAGRLGSEQRWQELTIETEANPSALQKEVAQDKLRQMFDERQSSVAFDRSQPFKPIARAPSKPRPIINNVRNREIITPLTNGAAAAEVIGSTLGRERKCPGNSERTDRVVTPMQRISMAKPLCRLRLAGNKVAAAPPKVQGHSNKTSGNNSNIRGTKFTMPPKRMPTRMSPLTFQVPARAKSCKTTTSADRSTHRTAFRTPLVVNTPAKQRNAATPAYVRQSSAQNFRRQANNNIFNRAASALPPGNLYRVKCCFCHRTFYPDRAHEEAYQKATNAKRKTNLDEDNHRIKSTDGKKLPRNQTCRKFCSSAAADTAINPAVNSSVRNTNWRQKHEEVIAAIRAAKRAHRAKLSDMQSPPPYENPDDHIQRPRFDEAGADTLIPRYTKMQHSKSKPNPIKRRSRK